jgi:L-lactate utilization protein LutB/heterodisulfide reductase subunit B
MSEDQLKQKISSGLADQSARMGRERALRVIKPAMRKAVTEFPYLRERLRAVKKYSIEHLDELIEKAIRAMRERGTRVFLADTPQQALEYIGKIVGQGLSSEGLSSGPAKTGAPSSARPAQTPAGAQGPPVVVKSKSNAGKEVGLVHFLEEQGATVVETDLGDRITQLDKSAPSHTMAPSIHVPIERVAELFSREVNETLHPELEELVRAARKSLRSFLLRADVGISGANAIVAETGAIVVTENEGNIRAVTSMPRVHVAIAGVEKIVPTMQDAITVVRSAAVFGVGQDIGTYVSFLSGPSRFENDDLAFLGGALGPQEMHVVLLKNGRAKAIRESYEESLYCINCGSCLNFCPVYAAIGEKFGYKYLGGRGAVFTAMHAYLDKAQEAGLSLCLGCKRCEEACAVGMQTPKMIARLRAQVTDEKGLPAAKRAAFHELAANHLPRWIAAAKAFQALGLQPAGDGMAKLRFPTENLPADRLLPRLANESFPRMVERRGKRKPQAEKRAAFFAGCVVNYVRPDWGVSALDILEKFGVEVVIAANEGCCGIPALESGDLADARAMARHNVETLSQAACGHLLFICPTCATAAIEQWPRLLENEPALAQKARELAAKALDISSYLVNVLKVKLPADVSGPGRPRPGAESTSAGEPRKVTYHDSCHLARGMNVTAEPRKLIESIPGVELVEMAEPDACCGFGGSFSLSYYNLSRRINDEKIKQIAATGAECVVAGCPGCVLHMKDGIHHAGGEQKVMHLVELLAQAFVDSEGAGK